MMLAGAGSSALVLPNCCVKQPDIPSLYRPILVQLPIEVLWLAPLSAQRLPSRSRPLASRSKIAKEEAYTLAKSDW